jgi:hypothetical protein
VAINEPEVVFTTNNLAEAEILKNVLEGEGIRCELDGENQGGFAGVIGVIGATTAASMTSGSRWAEGGSNER